MDTIVTISHFQEAEVRATQYLPNIARLQQCFYDKFNRQVDRKELNEQTIGDFVKNLPNGMRPVITFSPLTHA